MTGQAICAAPVWASWRQTPASAFPQPSAIAGIAGLLSEVSLADWQLYLTLHTLNSHAEVLPAYSGERDPLFRQRDPGFR